ncbi:NAD(P)-dependent oxidoreductase [Solibacillus sp. A46]|uniref:dihydrouracil dehydrogenase (NAD(+)) n=1 Tax=Solibacillus faecavium TaxID=2762221 RepID=A0ABR8XXA3_9BACL|nr:NAD(P)-dependent oxidoreductase [Solibacillus faecavium]MBD8036565.1 NAD(P)-dependent oxidoreductase [Solibacillus faecavium]
MSNSLAKNFEEIFGGLTTYAATVEANRCLYCYDPPCVKACPTSINIPSFIKKIASNNMKGSARVIMEANPVGASCARVCPTIELCEGACVLNSEEKPIQIGHLQRYATDWLRETDVKLFTPKPANGKKIAIIGSGPAGLSAARELALLGYGVTIYEADEKAGGLNYYGIVSFRLPQDVVEWEVQQVQNLGVEIKTSAKIGEDVLVDELLENFDRIIVAVGMGKVPMLNIEGEHLEGVYDAIDFVKESKASFTDKMLGKKAVVIGAGNTAIDAATCSVRLGAEQVQIVYRRTSKEMTAYDFEYDFAKQDGVEFRWLSLPKRIIGDEAGKVVGLECIKMKLTDMENGKGTLTEIPGSEFIIETDAVIRAIGQAKQYELIEHLGLANTRGVIDVEMNSLKTSNPKIYACGDVIYGNGYGEATVVSAAQQGKDSAYAIHYELNANSEIA